MDTNYTSRITADIVLVVCLLFTPWWITLSLGTLFSFVFERYYEAIAVGVALDLLYNIPRPAGTVRNVWQATELAVVIVFITQYLRKRIIALTL